MISGWKNAWTLGPTTWFSVAATLFMWLGAGAIRADHPAIVVALDGSGHFKTVQSAIDSIPDQNTERRVIVIKPGTYKERVVISETKTFLTVRGDDQDAARTILTFNRYAGMDDAEAPGGKVGTSGSESVLIRPDNFIAENITFANSAGEVGQAVAVTAAGDRQSFRNCRFLSWYDTLFVHGPRMYFKDCYIEGNLDFIFGRGTAVFENCQIHSKSRGVVTAAGTEPETPFGLVFLKCRLTGAGGKVYLGKPWQKGAATAFIECWLGEHLWPEGWGEWSGTENHKTARFVEYRNTGPGADTRKRPPWSRQLSQAEATQYTKENILSGPDRWNP